MFGAGKNPCSFCKRETQKKGSLRGDDDTTLVICAVCYTKWYGAGAECAECHTPVRAVEDAGVFLDRLTFGHMGCGAVRVRV